MIRIHFKRCFRYSLCFLDFWPAVFFDITTTIIYLAHICIYMKAGGTHKYAQIQQFLAAAAVAVALHNNIINLIAFGKNAQQKIPSREKRTHIQRAYTRTSKHLINYFFAAKNL